MWGSRAPLRARHGPRTGRPRPGRCASRSETMCTCSVAWHALSIAYTEGVAARSEVREASSLDGRRWIHYVEDLLLGPRDVVGLELGERRARATRPRVLGRVGRAGVQDGAEDAEQPEHGRSLRGDGLAKSTFLFGEVTSLNGSQQPGKREPQNGTRMLYCMPYMYLGAYLSMCCRLSGRGNINDRMRLLSGSLAVSGAAIANTRSCGVRGRDVPLQLTSSLRGRAHARPIPAMVRPHHTLGTPKKTLLSKLVACSMRQVCGLTGEAAQGRAEPE